MIDPNRIYEAAYAAAYVEQRFRYGQEVSDEACADRAIDHAYHAASLYEKLAAEEALHLGAIRTGSAGGHDPDPQTYGPCRRCGLGVDVDWSVSAPQDEHGKYIPCRPEFPLRRTTTLEKPA